VERKRATEGDVKAKGKPGEEEKREIQQLPQTQGAAI
jgi:hypothetical protein